MIRRSLAIQGCIRLVAHALVTTAIALSAVAAFATPATDFSFTDATTRALDFNEIVMSQSTVITNQYQSSHGVSFSPNVWFENHRSGIGWDDHNIANFLTGTSTVNASVDIIFSAQVTAAALEFTGNNGNSFTFEALLGGSVVESNTVTIATCCAAEIHGFRDVTFDSLRISHAAGGSQFFIGDQLTWNPVPEPGTAILVGLGLVGLATGLRRAA